MSDRPIELTACKTDSEILRRYRQKLPVIVENIIENSADPACFTHVDYEPIRSNSSVGELIAKFQEVLFPGYFSREKIDPINLKYSIGQTISDLYDMLSDYITHVLRHDCFRYNQDCLECGERGNQAALAAMEAIPELRRLLATDVRAVFNGDPAAKSHDEIIFSYPGIFATMVHRVAHKLFELEVPLLPRIMSEHAHSLTGIDIHPGATIGESFVIDHGTGVVIGETTRIGKDVRIYQGVTLGALSLPRDTVDRLRGENRHPTIEDNVIVYSGATILGGETTIGTRSVIGGNVWITESVPPDTRVFMETPKLIYK
ncbi:MAG: serine acetyltransferase [Desulfobacterales bacterium]|nr:serine acetyltransferase [Desulfobacterales bacterium]